MDLLPKTIPDPVIEEAYDPLDMNNYRVEKLRIMEKKGFELWMEVHG